MMVRLKQFFSLPALRKLTRIAGIVVLVFIGVIVTLTMIGWASFAAGLVDEPTDGNYLYSMFPLSHYQLDFYVDNSWGWLPWNWVDSIGKGVMYGIYAITNFLWSLSVYLSSATGALVQEAFNLDFISDLSDAIGANIQRLAGVSMSGISSDGLYFGFLMLFILILGLYVAYTGLVKRETTKAFSAAINFVLIFVASGFFIAAAPEVIGQINGFSREISTGMMDIGSQMTFENGGTPVTGNGDGTNLMRENLFAIQIYQPWILLQFGTTDISVIGQDRINALLASDPDLKEREEAAETDIETYENGYMTTTKVILRLGMTFFIFIFNIGITAFVFLLTGYMLLSQVLFIVYAMFLPISGILSILPTQEGLIKKAVMRLFNTIMFRAGITLIVVIALSISSMLYALSASYSFFMIALLQIVTFLGIYIKMNDILGMMSLQEGGNMQGIGRRMTRYPRMMMRRQYGRMNRYMRRAGYGGRSGRAARQASAYGNTRARTARAASTTWNQNGGGTASRSARAGQAVGNLVAMPGKARGKMAQAKDAVKNAPYDAVYRAQRSVSDFTGAVTGTIHRNREQSMNKRNQRRREAVARRRAVMGGHAVDRMETREAFQVTGSRETPGVLQARVRNKGNVFRGASVGAEHHQPHQSMVERERRRYINPGALKRRGASDTMVAGKDRSRTEGSGTGSARNVTSGTGKVGNIRPGTGRGRNVTFSTGRVGNGVVDTDRAGRMSSGAGNIKPRVRRAPEVSTGRMVTDTARTENVAQQRFGSSVQSQDGSYVNTELVKRRIQRRQAGGNGTGPNGYHRSEQSTARRSYSDRESEYVKIRYENPEVPTYRERRMQRHQAGQRGTEQDIVYRQGPRTSSRPVKPRYENPEIPTAQERWQQRREDRSRKKKQRQSSGRRMNR